MNIEDTILYKQDKFKKRTIGDLEKLSDLGFHLEVINYNSFNVKYKDYNLTIEIPDNYPFGGIYVNKYHYIYASARLNECISDYIKNFIESYSVLIYCHPRKITLEDKSSHFLINFIEKIILDNKDNSKDKQIKIYTIDVKYGGDYYGDGFSDDFINQNKGIFNIVFVPDCSGIWFTKQEEQDYDYIINLLGKIKSICKEEGNLWFSKIIYYDEYKNLIDNVADKYVDDIYNSNIFKLK